MFSKKILLILIILIIGSIVTTYTYVHITEFDKVTYEKLAQEDLEEKAHTLEALMNKKVRLVYDVIPLIQKETLNQETFQEVASELIGDIKGIRSLQLSPDAIVTYVYPIAGNEAAIGHNLLTDEVRKDIVLRTIENSELVIAGPVALRQGGVALIVRHPIYTLNKSSEQLEFWGMSAVLIDYNTLLSEANIDAWATDRVYALKGTNGLGFEGDTFYGEEDVFQGEHQYRIITLPNGEWIIASAEKQKQVSTRAKGALLGGIAITFILILVTLLINKPKSAAKKE